MRVRNRKGATELLEANPQYVVLNPADAKGKWQELFGNDHPIHIEVGSGKGAFITGMAKANPNINYIGIDIQKSVLSYALDKVLATDVPNIKLLWVDGSDLTNYFAEVYFKTDNRGLFEYSLVSFSQYGMKLKGVWLDLHASDFEGNVLTEYEQKFSSKGQVIYRVEAVF